ncbi:MULTISPECIES: F0F1 ATP synthase subunit gamma [Companilactobacillus]|uniref:ATP synthase gamma chain n=5 Tax=Companilactobacillus TaxID=2767879 RepID=A0A202FG71_9LACO|nr:MULTISPECIES: F0F1 ATP synthase subunit gamma [Companilactobacillus]KAE9560170.1 ATP synthase F0F1 subunit gamma [Companilactobacillus bobalius]KAE9561262.1 ATP synthase F0F1 subunit gamma [Companilactobacillus kimchii]KAE9564178.1 ATP synthase F0F1 subunit gamma [Companilactobacillus paralimentarius]MDR4933703.1 F0F1 ATP synthase subunit gamma [Companilactobacillus paralimentarius]OVE99458.1 ATP synthase gamma chain [Companilactobacillus bobalius]
MAESLMDIKRRISSTKKTGQITKAMQMVSGAKLSRIEKKSIAYQLYEKKVEDIVRHLTAADVFKELSVADDSTDPLSLNSLLKVREVKKTAYVVITSDRGLVGGYNSNILKAMMDLFQKKYHGDKSKFTIISLGATGTEFFKARGFDVAYEYTGLPDIPTVEDITPIMKTILQMYQAELFDEIDICHNHHVNSLVSKFTTQKLLPLTEPDDVTAEEQQVASEYITEPNPKAVLSAIVPQYIECLVLGAMMDAKTAEHAASVTAMKSASDNADDLIAGLSLHYNRARQAQITTEITEIIGGAAALE